MSLPILWVLVVMGRQPFWMLQLVEKQVDYIEVLASQVLPITHMHTHKRKK